MNEVEQLFNKLKAKRQAILDRAEPLRAQRQSIQERIAPLEAQSRELTQQIREIENPDLFTLEMQIGSLAKALGATVVKADSVGS